MQAHRKEWSACRGYFAVSDIARSHGVIKLILRNTRQINRPYFRDSANTVTSVYNVITDFIHVFTTPSCHTITLPTFSIVTLFFTKRKKAHFTKNPGRFCTFLPTHFVHIFDLAFRSTVFTTTVRAMVISMSGRVLPTGVSTWSSQRYRPKPASQISALTQSSFRPVESFFRI